MSDVPAGLLPATYGRHGAGWVLPVYTRTRPLPGRIVGVKHKKTKRKIGCFQ